MGGLPKIVNKKVIYLEVGAIFFFIHENESRYNDSGKCINDTLMSVHVFIIYVRLAH